MIEWCIVRGHPRYKVSTNGDVVGPYGRVLKPMMCGAKRKQYATIRLSTSPRIDVKVHVLVLEAFRGPRPTGMQACHRDDDTLNNKLDNLYWGTPSENRRDCVINAPLYSRIEKTRVMLSTGAFTQRCIAKVVGLSEQAICDIVKGRRKY